MFVVCNFHVRLLTMIVVVIIYVTRNHARNFVWLTNLHNFCHRRQICDLKCKLVLKKFQKTRTGGSLIFKILINWNWRFLKNSKNCPTLILSSRLRSWIQMSPRALGFNISLKISKKQLGNLASRVSSISGQRSRPSQIPDVLCYILDWWNQCCACKCQ
jgi:hypothetical protein